MTSGSHSIVDLSFIKINRDQRQRRKISDDHISALADSISRLGLIHPPVITRDGDLIAGECRVTAMKSLGWTRTPIQWQDELDAKTLTLIELEENIKRKDVAWEDECRAVAELHAILSEQADWTIAKTAEEIGMGQSSVTDRLAIARELASGNERVKAAPRLTVARNIVARKDERQRTDQLLQLREVIHGPAEDKIIVADFLKWAPEYSGPPFNFIHCDFPYGINADKFDQGSAKEFGGYADTFDHYTRLIACLKNNKDKLFAESAHMIFWFSMEHYTYTLDMLSEAFWVDTYPLIWNKGNMGILPDASRRPRRVYETAFLCSLGDRKIIQAVPNVASYGLDRSGAHMSEKSQDMLKHFFRMIVDENTSMLDPTCGSGSALRAAESLGAKRVLGLEINPEFAQNARLALGG